jgi:hypothetical protein
MQTAIRILELLHKGRSKEQILREFNGDGQLVDGWILFLKYNKWVITDARTQEFKVSQKGTIWARKYGKRLE